MIIEGSSFWSPVGVSIFAGGIGALIAVVTVLPVLYWKLYGKEDQKRCAGRSLLQKRTRRKRLNVSHPFAEPRK